MDCISGWCKSKRRLDGLTAIVTGSNAGIGRETALDFYLRGARVIMACRSMERAEAAKRELEQDPGENKGMLLVEKLDTSNFKSVRDFANLILEREDQINILVNNAGVFLTKEERTEDGLDLQMVTNHYGPSLLTLLLLPKLIAGSARVVFVSSTLHKNSELNLDDMDSKNIPFDAHRTYAWSKSAVIMFSRILAKKLKEKNINVSTYSLHPGLVRTAMAKEATGLMMPGGKFFYNMFQSVATKSVRCGAQTSIYCAVDEKCANQTGLYYNDCAVSTPSKQCRNDAAGEKLWELTLKAVGIDDPFAAIDSSKM